MGTTILEDKNLFDIITKEQFDKTIAGELPARRAIFLSLCSVFVEDCQINTLVNSESSAGKSYICGKIRKIFPETMVEYRTRVSPTAFTYWHNAKFEPEWTWNGKICYLEDISDAIVNSDVFKVMCSEGSIATVVIKQRAFDIKINGKPSMLLTAANAIPKNEILNRFNLITLNETESQTGKVLTMAANKAMTTKKEVYDESVTGIFQFLKQVKVTVPYASKLMKYFNGEVRSRRDFGRFLDLVKCSAALHQMQRKTYDEGFIEANEQDYEYAREAVNYMATSLPVGLTHRLAKAYLACKDLYEIKKLEYMETPSRDLTKPLTELQAEPIEKDTGPLGFTQREIWAHCPIVSESNWYIYLGVLTARKLLSITLEEPDRKKGRPHAIYSINEDSSITLPPFEFI